MKNTSIASLVLFLLIIPAQSYSLNVNWVEIGDPGNAVDSGNGYGKVDYTYQISQYEITNTQYAEFLNSVAATDTYELYHTSMANDSISGGITRSGSSGSYTYMVNTGFENKPVTYVNWYDAIRFTNWMHNGMPTGAQDNTTTENGAYHLTGIASITTDPGESGIRKSGALVWLPNEDEWYKAAYYDTSTGVYFDYAVGSDDVPTAENPPGNFTPSANYDNAIGDVTNVGAYTTSPSPNNTYDQNGNVWEWNEDLIVDSNGQPKRQVRGGGFSSPADYPFDTDELIAEYDQGYTIFTSTQHFQKLGYRIASVSNFGGPISIPEPFTLILIAIGCAGLARKSRR